MNKKISFSLFFLLFKSNRRNQHNYLYISLNRLGWPHVLALQGVEEVLHDHRTLTVRLQSYLVNGAFSTTNNMKFWECKSGLTLNTLFLKKRQFKINQTRYQ